MCRVLTAGAGLGFSLSGISQNLSCSPASKMTEISNKIRATNTVNN